MSERVLDDMPSWGLSLAPSVDRDIALALCRRNQRPTLPSGAPADSVYFIQCTATRRVKIGVSRHPEKRLRDLQVGAPADLVLLGTIPGSTAEEADLHRRLAKSAVRGEWFDLTDDMERVLGQYGIVARTDAGGSGRRGREAPAAGAGIACVFSGRRWSHHFESDLAAYWEVHGDPISDDYTPDDGSPSFLFRLWRTWAAQRHPDGNVPIYWYVEGTNGRGIESLPGAPHNGGAGHDFLTWYSWPVVSLTGEPLVWTDLPVVNKLWRESQANKGGFIQEHTGWKPTIYQPYVQIGHLDTLAEAKAGGVPR